MVRTAISVASLLFALLGLFGVASAAEVKLEDLIKEALAKNQSVAASFERARSFEASINAEGALDDPMLTIEAMDLIGDPMPGSSQATRYMLSQSLPFFGKRALKKSVAEQEAEGARYSAGAVALDTVYEVKSAYYEYAYTQGALALISEARDISTQVALAVEALYKANKVSQSDLIRARAEVSMVDNEALAVKSLESDAAIRLGALLDKDAPVDLGEPEPLKEPLAKLDPEMLANKAASMNPEIKSLLHGQRGKELGVELARKNYYPDFMLGLGPVQREGGFESMDVMFQVSLPVWQGKYSSLEKKAIADNLEAKAELNSQTRRISSSVRALARQMESEEARLKLFDNSLIPQSELAFESYMRSYASASSGLSELLDAARTLNRLRIERLRSLLEYNVKLAMLERLVGEDFER